MIRLAVGVAALAMPAAVLAQEADPPPEQIVVLPLPRVDVIIVQGAGLPWIEGGDSVEARTVVTGGRPGLGARVENRLRDEAGLRVPEEVGVIGFDDVEIVPRGSEISVTVKRHGVELRPDLVGLCNGVARRLALDRLLAGHLAVPGDAQRAAALEGFLQRHGVSGVQAEPSERHCCSVPDFVIVVNDVWPSKPW